VLRSDLSVSVGELGSLLEHTGPVGAAEAQAAQTFGADLTMFVTNGTSTANKVVFCSCVREGDIVLVDRNCHKSIMHAIILTRAIPVFLHPVRNAYGIIGPIPPSEFEVESISARLATNPLVAPASGEPRLAVVTNSTYDGLCYDATAVLGSLAESTPRVMFDEAWFAYAHFHPLYRGRHAMGVAEQPPRGVATFATQSTHKLLAAFSQGSMVHLRDPNQLIGEQALDEAFMMHTSTSPQYGIIASLDVATRMMAGSEGQDLLDGVLERAIAFRRELAAVRPAADGWWFRAWQPPAGASGTSSQERAQDTWLLRDADPWHGFGQIGDGHTMLDPTKVTILTPGIGGDGALKEFGIPAAIVARFLDERGVVVEKTGEYSFLVLFSLGITRGKAGTLLAELLEFRRLYESGAPLENVLPRLASEHSERYGGRTLRGLSDELQRALRDVAMSELTEGMYSALPEPVMTPADAHGHIVAGTVEMVGTDSLAGRVSAAMLVPYPPGIPVIMPGERFPARDGAVLRYLRACEKLSLTFPGFETEIHGIQLAANGSYLVPCAPGRPSR
jgi:arginine decarboxylase